MLEAALAHGPKALESWRRWAVGGRLERTEPDDHSVLPSVYLNLVPGGTEATEVPHAGRLKGVYRRDWYGNQILFPPAAELLERLDGEQLPALVLGPAALVGLGYLDGGARPIGHVDVFVSPDAAATAIAVIERMGWRALGAPPRDVLAVRPGWLYTGPAGGRIQLRWRLFSRSRADERAAFRVAMPVSVAGAATQTLDAADQLLYIVSESVAWRPLAPLTWILDALAVLRAAPRSIDWGRFHAEAWRHRLAFSAAALLDYLRDRFEADIPDGEIARLRAIPVARSERSLHRALMQASPSVTDSARIHWACYRALAATRPGGSKPIGFPDYLAQRGNFDGAGGLVRHVVARRHRGAGGLPAGGARTA